MTKEKTQHIHRLFSILLSIVIVIAGICLIAACVGIYKSGDQPFSREAVARAFTPIAIPVYLCLILTIIGFIWELISPISFKKAKTDRPYRLILERLQENRDMSQCDTTIREAIATEHKKRRQLSIISTAIICIASVIFLIYACNSNNFDNTDSNGSVIKAMWVLIPCMAAAFACGLFCIINNEKSLKAEIELIKQAPVSDRTSSAKEGSKESNNADNSARNTMIIRVVVLAAAVALVLIGYFTGGTADVLTKAINICTECIGLG